MGKLKIDNTLEVPNHRLTQSAIWDSGVVLTCVWCTFDLLVFKVILTSFGALVSKWSVIQKQIAIERRGLKFWIRW